MNASALHPPEGPLPLVAEYLNGMQRAHRSTEYIRKVRTALVDFSGHARQFHIVHPQQITLEVLLDFQASLDQRGWATSTKVQRMKYVRGWIRWLGDGRHLEETLWTQIPLARYDRGHNPLAAEEVDALFAAHRRHAQHTDDPFAHHRREVILVILCRWGPRVNELASLDVDDVADRHRFVRCLNRGGGIKHLPYTPVMKEVIARYLIHRARYADPTAAPTHREALLITRSGRRLSTRSLRAIVTDLGTRAGVDDLNPRRLRDTARAFMVTAGMPRDHIRSVLG